MAGKLQNSITIGSKIFDGTKSISIDKSDIGLGNVDNTADRDKHVLCATRDGSGNDISNTYIKLKTINNFSDATPYNNIIYTSKIDDWLAACNKWANVTLSDTVSTAEGGLHSLFSGDYETWCIIAAGNSGVITIDFSGMDSKKYPEYPYGDLLFYFYYSWYPKSISVRVYNNWSGQEVGWHDLEPVNISNTFWKANTKWYGLEKIEITITARDDSKAKITAIEFNRSRQSLNQPQPVLFKYKPETLYYQLTAPSFNGNLTGNASSSTISDSTKWIEYE